MHWLCTTHVSWNHKFLDYEIETENALKMLKSTTEGWNHKFLDYEIETNLYAFVSLLAIELES